MRLVPYWQKAWKWYSVHFLALLTAIPIVWMELPPDVKDMIPPDWRPWLVGCIGAAGIMSRLKAQRP